MEDGWWRLLQQNEDVKEVITEKSIGGMKMNRKKRILTGDRPTGKLHIGHYAGSLKNRVKLQHEYETFIIIADVQALTTNFESPELLERDVLDVTLDNLAVGVDPEVATYFIQSMVPQIAELTIFYSMLVSVNALRHNPTIKTEAAQRGYDDMSYGFLGYPVSQAADITFCKADLVPAGEDQQPHMEAARKIVRRFNSLYKPVLVEPEILLSDCPRLVGLDGNSKMSKSMGNAIFLADGEEEISAKVKTALTDTKRITLQDKGTPEVCMVYEYHKVFNGEESENIAAMCRSASIGCVACKKRLAGVLDCTLQPIREKRKKYAERPDKIKEMLFTGTEKACKIAEETMSEIRAAMHIKYL